ncbi:hypothetical protein EDD59_11678 [Muricomes intestini]|jgi:hypothetical protein|uniref:Uncharacterized protein n=1 Tax=Muricomes intestini TaxID=1796634 RepID=A0A4R3K4J5_9FIRM|nr:hypothetical protein EDD59_11678 [Muricomes intestini]
MFMLNLYVQLLLCNYSNETVCGKYLDLVWKMPLIGPRPPFYTNPRYNLSYPTI